MHKPLPSFVSFVLNTMMKRLRRLLKRSVLQPFDSTSSRSVRRKGSRSDGRRHLPSKQDLHPSSCMLTHEHAQFRSVLMHFQRLRFNAQASMQCRKVWLNCCVLCANTTMFSNVPFVSKKHTSLLYTCLILPMLTTDFTETVLS